MSKKLDICSTDLALALRPVADAMKHVMSSSGLSDAKQVALKQVLGDFKDGIEELAEIASKGNLAADEIDRHATKLVNDAMLDFNTYSALDNELSMILRNNKTDSVNGVRDIMTELLQRTANISNDVREEFSRQLDNIIDDIATGGKDVTEDQLSSARTLFMDIVGGGDEAIKRYLLKKGVDRGADDLILQGMKSGHITSTATNLTELDLAFKALKKLETGIQGAIENTVKGYKALKGHAFVASIDAGKAATMAVEDFVDNMFINGKFILDLSDDPIWTKKVANLSTEKLHEAQRSYVKGIYEKLKGRTDVSNKSRLGGVFEDRNFKFTDAQSEMHFFKTYAANNNGLFRGRINHLQHQLVEMATRSEVSTNPDRWLEHAQRVVNNNTMGKLKSDKELSKIKKLFKQLKASTDRVTGRESYLGETLSDIWQITHNTLQAAATPLSVNRQVYIDGSAHSGIIEASFKNNSVLMNYMKHTAELIRYMAGAGYKGTSQKKLMELLQDNMISVKMGRAEAIRRLYSPAITEFESGTGWLSKIRKYSEKQADIVSKYGLGDASYRATRIKGAIHAGAIIRRLTTNKATSKQLLTRYGISEDEWNGIFKHLKTIKAEDGSDIMFDLRHGLLDVPDEVLQKFSVGVESIDATRSRIGRKITHMHQDLIDDFASRPTMKTGISIISDSDNEYVRFIHSLITKFMGIALSQQQSLIRAIRRMNGSYHQTTGWMGTGVDSVGDLISGITKRDKIMTNMSLLTALVGSGYMVEATKSLINGKTPPELDSELVFSTITNSGAGGILSAMAASMYYKGDFVGTPAGRQVRAGMGVASGLAKGVVDDDWEKFNSKIFDFGKSTIFPASSLLIRNNSAQELYIREWLGLTTEGIERNMSRRDQELLID